MLHEKFPSVPVRADFKLLKISGFTRPHVIGFVADLFFSTLESGFIFFRIRCRIRRMRVDGSRIRKEKVADS